MDKVSSFWVVSSAMVHLSLLALAASVAAAPASVSYLNASRTTLLDLGSWTTSIASVTTQDPVVSATDVFEQLANNLWSNYWSNSSDSWIDQCQTNNAPVLWPVAVAGEAIAQTGAIDKLAAIAHSFLAYKSKLEGGYLATTAQNDDIYTDDDAQVVWALVSANKNLPLPSYLDDASNLLQYIDLKNNLARGGVIWSINGDYLATISSLEAALAAVKLNAAEEQDGLVDMAKYYLVWTISNLMDDTDKFFFDGMDVSGKVNNGKLTYTVGTAISTMAYLQKWDTEYNWQAMAVELAVRVIGGGNLNSQFYSDGNINDQIRYLHLLYGGFADLLELTKPDGSYQQLAYAAIKNAVVKDARHIYDQNKNTTIKANCLSGYNQLLDYASITQIFYQVLRVVDRI